MFRFFKEHSYDITKMFINQVGMTILGIIVSMSTMQFSNKLELTQGNRWPLLAGSVFAICFYLFLLWYMTSEIGRKEGIRIEAGRLRYNPLKGLYMSLWANSINLVLALLAIVGKLFVNNIGFFSGNTTTVGTPAFAAGLNSISEKLLKVLNAMYLGIQVEYFSGNPLFYLLIIVPSLIVCAFAYIYGVNRIRKGDKKDEEKRQKYEMEKEKQDIYYQQ